MATIDQCEARPAGELAAVYNNEAYQAHDPALQVECIYFYYLTMRALPDPKNVRAYFIDKRQYIPRGQMQGEIVDLVGKVRRTELTPLGHRLGALDWSRKSYIAVVLDDPNVRLTANNAIMFVNRIGGLGHPFRDGMDITPFDTITGFFCINHMTPPPGQEQAEYWSDSFLIEACHNPLGCTPPIPTFYSHNDSGTNMGPPIPPP